MKGFRIRGWWAAAIAALMAPSAYAAGPTVEFSAEAVQQVPDQDPSIARMHVGGPGVRMEYDQSGQQMVEIYNLAERRALLLMPQQKMYMERPMPEGAPLPMMGDKPKANPCANAPGASCQRLGEETVDGRRAVKWEMTAEHEGQTYRSVHWIDVERNLPLRQQWPDGTVSELRILGQERLNGRPAEKWELVTTRPDGESTRSVQWYDPELKITVREELPGGYLRELRNIRVASQPAQLFQVPAGYQRTEPPNGREGAQGGGQPDQYRERGQQPSQQQYAPQSQQPQQYRQQAQPSQRGQQPPQQYAPRGQQSQQYRQQGQYPQRGQQYPQQSYPQQGQQPQPGGQYPGQGGRYPQQGGQYPQQGGQYPQQGGQYPQGGYRY